MKQFTIYCTEEQCKKAESLGAPIEKVSHSLGEPFKPECTAEQMIGFLESCDNVGSIEVIKDYNFSDWTFLIFGKEGVAETYNEYKHYQTREDSTLAAIDATLCYLTKNKDEQ